jgi:hypothetical protein
VVLPGINAGAAKEEEFPDIMPETLSYDIILDLQIAIYKIGPVSVVGDNTTHVGRSKDYILGFFPVKKRFYSSGIQQV